MNVHSRGLAVMGMEYDGGLMPAGQCKLLNNTRIGFNAASIRGNPGEPFFGGPLTGSVRYPCRPDRRD